ncbi:hypothetical protein ABMA27_006277 [Loxostege sticticalis]|uniref:Gustatory receptor n=1 Tax=Loxostege sticticalis TaxID=481309 RepID=A0ABR3HI76_LOXSC
MGTTKIRKNLSKTLIYYDNFFENNWLNKCYLFLIEQNNYLNKVFGFRVTLTSHVIGLVTLMHRFEKTYELNVDILNILDHILIDSNISESMRNTLVEFRRLVLSRPIKFTAANFYRLDYSFLITFSSVVITYSLIFLNDSE